MLKIFINAGIIKVVSQLAGFLTIIVLSKNLTISEYSELSYFLTVVFIFSLIIYSGSQIAITQNVAKFSLDIGGCSSLEYIKFLLQILCGLFLTIISIYLLYLYFLEKNIDLFTTLVFLSVIGMAGPPIISAFLRGVDKIIISIIVEPLLRTIIILAFISIVIYFELHLSMSIIVYYSVGLLVALIMSIFFAKANFMKFLKNNSSKLTLTKKDKKHFKSQWILLTAYGFFISVSGHMEIVILDMMGFTNDLGRFRNYLAMSGIILLPAIIINQMLQNRTVKLFFNNEIPKLGKVLLEGNKISTVIASFLGFIFWIYGKEIIEFVFSVQYSDKLFVFYILLMAQVTNVFFGASGMVINMTQNHVAAVKILTISFTIQIVLTPILIAYFELIGAAYAMLLGVIIWKLLMWRWVRQKFSINTSFLLYYIEKRALNK